MESKVTEHNRGGFGIKGKTRKSFLKLLLISIIILLQSSIASTQMLELPLDDELYREAYDLIDRFIASGYITRINKNTRPYSRGEVTRILSELSKKVKEGTLKLSKDEEKRLNLLFSAFSQKDYLFQTQGEEYQFGFDFGIGESIISHKQELDENKSCLATLFHPTVEGQIRDDFAFRSDLKAYYLYTPTQFPISALPKTEVWNPTGGQKTITATLSNYYMKAKLPWFSLLFGYDNLHWGPGRHGALLLSKEPLPMYMLRLQARYYPFKFQAVTAKLGSNKKYLAGHRLEFNLWDKLHLGIAETVVYGRRFEVVYLNPMQIYTTTEFIFPSKEGENDNVLISGDIDLTVLKNLELYGEVMIDDYQLYEPRDWGTKFGILFGGYWVDPFGIPDTDLRLEYAFVNQYAYTHQELINVYTHFGSPIGHRIGNDADDLWISLKHWFTDKIIGSISYEIERHGETDITEGSDYDKLEEESPDWEFLSGVTESKHSISLEASCNLIGRYSANLRYTHSWIRNAANQPDVKDSGDQILLSGQYRF
jgi:hypothetical protein